ALSCAATQSDFWTVRKGWLAALGFVSLLFAFGTSLPFFRALYNVPALRRFRYPIKFYLLTTLCACLLAGFAAERLRPDGRPARRGRTPLQGLPGLLAGALAASTSA